MTRRAEGILELVGETPLLRLARLAPADGAEVWAKAEFFNPAGSVKDRIGKAMLAEAEREGRLPPGGTIVEPTSGNTGLALAMAAAAGGYRLILSMPETMSRERRSLLAALGAELVLTPGKEGMPGAIREADRIAETIPGCFRPDQFSNPANPEAHRLTTGPEIIAAAPAPIDAFAAGVGTGGTITGVGTALRQRYPEILIAAVEPAASPVLAGGKPGPHKIQGIGAGFVPAVLDTAIYDEVIPVKYEAARRTARDLARKEGILAGISSGANVWAALELAGRLGPGKTVVTILCDTGERYLSTDLFRD